MKDERGLGPGIRSRETGIRDQEESGGRTGREMGVKSAKELRVYQKAYALAMEIFQVSKGWPFEEKYSLTDQIRRSSRSVCANIRESWSKRRYEAHFVSKLTDADGENAETDTWLDFARDCGYLSSEDHKRLIGDCQEVGAMLGAMLNNPEPFVLKGRRS